MGLLVIKWKGIVGDILRVISFQLWWIFRLIPPYFLPSYLLVEEILYHEIREFEGSRSIYDFKWREFFWELWINRFPQRAMPVLKARNSERVILKFLKSQGERDFQLRKQQKINAIGIFYLFNILESKENTSADTIAELRRWVVFPHADVFEKNAALRLLLKKDPDSFHFLLHIAEIFPLESLDTDLFSILIEKEYEETILILMSTLKLHGSAKLKVARLTAQIALHDKKPGWDLIHTLQDQMMFAFLPQSPLYIFVDRCASLRTLEAPALSWIYSEIEQGIFPRDVFLLALLEIARKYKTNLSPEQDSKIVRLQNLFYAKKHLSDWQLCLDEFRIFFETEWLTSSTIGFYSRRLPDERGDGNLQRPPRLKRRRSLQKRDHSSAKGSSIASIWKVRSWVRAR